MSVDDIFARSSRDGVWHVRSRLIRRGLGLPGPGRRGPGGRGRLTARARRRLTAIDRALAVETPRLASMFGMFNQLAAAEPVGAERLPARAWPRPRLAQVAFLATLAAIVALCVVLSTQVHSVMRTCLSSASSSASPAASPATSPAAGVSGPSAFSPARSLSCQAYATTNK
jgi:hypothetical protein